jgi:hypothetical protein
LQCGHAKEKNQNRKKGKKNIKKHGSLKRRKGNRGRGKSGKKIWD